VKGLVTPAKARVDRGTAITLAGKTGRGKTSLGALFPKSVFLRTEDGTQAIESVPDALVTPLLASHDDVMTWLRRLAREDHDRTTLVIDTITKLDAITEAEIVEDAETESLNQAYGGYGAGFRVLADRMGQVRGGCQYLQIHRKMHVVFLAHSEIVTYRPQDGEPYDVLGLKMNGKSVAPFVDDVDLVGFLRLRKEFDKDKTVKGRKIAISQGARELVCHAHAAMLSKNRLGITEPLDCPLGVNPILPLLEKGRD